MIYIIITLLLLSCAIIITYYLKNLEQYFNVKKSKEKLLDYQKIMFNDKIYNLENISEYDFEDLLSDLTKTHKKTEYYNCLTSLNILILSIKLSEYDLNMFKFLIYEIHNEVKILFNGENIYLKQIKIYDEENLKFVNQEYKNQHFFHINKQVYACLKKWKNLTVYEINGIFTEFAYFLEGAIKNKFKINELILENMKVFNFLKKKFGHERCVYLLLIQNLIRKEDYYFEFQLSNFIKYVFDLCKKEL